MFFLIIISRNASDKQCNLFLSISCLVWAMIFGLRGHDVGNDTPGYAGFFELTNSSYGDGYGTYEAPGNSIEWGFVAFCRFLALFSDSATFLFVVHATFLFIVIYLLYKDNRNSVMSLLWLMIFGSTLSMLMVALRQSISTAFVLLSYILFDNVMQRCETKREIFHERQFIYAMICFVFAMTIHRTSIIFFPIMAMLYFIRVKKRFVYVALSITFIISVIFTNLLSEIFDTFMLLIGGVENEHVNLLADRYGDDAEREGASIISKVAFIAPIYLMTYFADDEKLGSLNYKCLIFGTILFLLFSSSTVITRIILVFMVLGYSIIIPSEINDNKRMYFLYLIFTVYYLWRAFVHLAVDLGTMDNTYILYRFVWEN